MPQSIISFNLFILYFFFIPTCDKTIFSISNVKIANNATKKSILTRKMQLKKFSNINDLRLLVSKVLYEENDLSTFTDVIEANFKYVISSIFKSSGSSSFDTSSSFKIFENVHIDLNPVFFSKTVFIFSCTALPILFCALSIVFCTSNTILMDLTEDNCFFQDAK